MLIICCAGHGHLQQGQEQDFDEDRGDEYEEENGPYESGEEEEDGRNYGEGMDRPDSAIDSQHSGSGELTRTKLALAQPVQPFDVNTLKRHHNTAATAVVLPACGRNAR